MLNTLRHRRDLVALEAFSATDVVGLLKKTFPSIHESFVGIAGQFSGASEQIKLTSKEREFIREVNSHSFGDLMDQTAFVPEGMHDTYVRYIDTLTMAANHSAGMMARTLTPFSEFLGQLVNTSEAKFSSADFSTEYAVLDRERENITKRLGESFGSGTETTRPYSSVVDRNADWPKVFQGAENLARIVNGIDRKALDRKVKECGTLIDVLMKKLTRGDLEGVSPEVVRAISDGAYQAASEVAFYAAIHHKVVQLNAAISRTVDEFKVAA